MRSFSSVPLYASVASSAFRYSVLSCVSSWETDRSAGREGAADAVAAGTAGTRAAAAVIAAAQTEPTIRPDT
ncbi:hypothetical protein I1A49_30030 [Streptomyces malaysiensis subsp. malaysiensis]|uniref:Secreted protein n=1 Tax=Streptomyces malaysiensis TaxID=92644 RepID=A0ABX6WDB1_STRMQ|nr:hypothetical protein [Streptomyces solisilvae]QPI58580.1 hypothetical protein I1A49_30030 [Streptomyces solisilvae]